MMCWWLRHGILASYVGEKKMKEAGHGMSAIDVTKEGCAIVLDKIMQYNTIQ